MKKTLLVLAFVFAFFANRGFSQLNMSLVGQRSYPVELSDIWGWVAPDGTEYALVGLNNGTSIVSLADPSNPEEVAFIPGASSTWRDIKTWGHFAYVTTDQPGTTEGLLVIDLSNLPESVDYYNWRPSLPNLGTLNTCHNIYIDENGYGYLAGCNINNGGMIILDLFSQPGTPLFAGRAPGNYSHDVYTRNDRMYSAELNLGRLAIYDVGDKANPTLLGSVDTPLNFTHNVWLSDDGTVAYTTDERSNAPVAAYDVTDPTDIIELDQYRPAATLGEGVIPHNVHVWDDWLIISYYTDGCIVVDGSRPGNLVEVGNFDTFLGGNGGFNGAWGAYPYLPSGLVLVSDINSGLYVLQPNYVRACWLEGRVTNAANGNPLNNVQVEILSNQPNTAASNAGGNYATGQALSGTFPVRFQRLGFKPKVVNAALNNGELTVLDVELEPAQTFNIQGSTVTSTDGSPIPFADVLLYNDLTSYQASGNAAGNFFLINSYEGTYNVYAAAWGYYTEGVEVVIDDNDLLTITLTRGYRDDFTFDLGWTTSSEGATSGYWERGVPIRTDYFGQSANPGEDVDGDFGEECYFTGNGGGGAGTDDVDDGTVTLTSPPMVLTDFTDPVLSYQLWFFNASGDSPPNDALTVSVTNGLTTVVLEELTESGSQWRPASEFHLAEYIELTDNVQVIFETSDLPGTGHVVEAGVDNFSVLDAAATSTNSFPEERLSFRVDPNPFSETLQISFQITTPAASATLHLFDATGRRVLSQRLDGPQATLYADRNLSPGLYIARLEVDGQWSAPVKVVKGR